MTYMFPAIVIGLLVMMWPILTKGKHTGSSKSIPNPAKMYNLYSTVQYERLPALFRTVHIWRQVVLSLILNWIVGPFVSRLTRVSCGASFESRRTMQVMLAVAWATLPDLPTYRTGVIMVGLAR
jgi:ACR3 family arsenite transporter